MRYQFHAVVERAVAFDVDMLLILIGNSEYLVSIIAVFTCSVNFKLNTEISMRIAIEDRLRFVSVVVDAPVTIYLIMITLTTVVVSVKMISIILMQ